jgi:hypothetical protein
MPGNSKMTLLSTKAPATWDGQAEMFREVWKTVAFRLGVDPQLWDVKGDAHVALNALHGGLLDGSHAAWYKHWFLTWVYKEEGDRQCDWHKGQTGPRAGNSGKGKAPQSTIAGFSFLLSFLWASILILAVVCYSQACSGSRMRWPR